MGLHSTLTTLNREGKITMSQTQAPYTVKTEILEKFKLMLSIIEMYMSKTGESNWMRLIAKLNENFDFTNNPEDKFVLDALLALGEG